jgi:fatty acid desaturase
MSTIQEVAVSFRRNIAWQAVQNFLSWIGFSAAGVFFWMHGWWPATVVCWAITAYFGHAVLLAFHEASHGHLHRVPRANEMAANMIGMVILVPVGAYRIVHGAHHAHLGSEGDLELWPYVDPSQPRWFRRLCVFLELTIGFFYTPCLFFRGVCASNVSQNHKRRVWRSYGVCALVWATVLSLVAYLNIWEYFLVGYLAPAILGGNVQSLRKLTEHLGLLGNTPETAARTIVPESLIGRYMCRTMLNVTHHAAHHRDAAARFDTLPEETARAVRDGDLYVFRSFTLAFLDMLPALANPRIGEQWLKPGTRMNLRSSDRGLLAGDLATSLPQRDIATLQHP